MAKTMTASTITDGQIDGIVDKLRAALRKHREEINSEIAQQVQGLPNLGMELFSVVRQHAERLGNLIVRRVLVNRTRSSQEMLDATGCRQYTDRKVVDAMPCGEGDEAEVIFFKPRSEAYVNGMISPERLEKEYEFQGLKPDPRAQAAVNEVDSDFASKKPNGVQWKDASGKWCYEAFTAGAVASAV